MSDPILFVPGLACTARLFQPQIDRFAVDRTIVLANHRRHADIPSIAGAILDEAPARFVLAGLSMGGYVAFEIMRRAPDRVSALVLLDTSARPDTPEATANRLRQIDLAERGRFAEIPRLQIPNLLAPDHVGDAALVGAVRTMAEATGPAAFVRQQRAIMARPDSRPGLGAIACPTLVVVGALDRLTPPDLAREIADAIPGARLLVVEGAGHLSTLERAADVTDAMQDFVDAVNL